MKDVFLTLLWIVFITDSILLVLIVLLQSGRGGGLAGMLGGGGMAESALGPKTGLPRITGIMAAIFFGCAILIGGLTRERTVVDPTRAEKEPEKSEGKGAPTTKTDQGAKEGGPKPKSATEPPKTATPAEPKAPTPKTTTAAPAKTTTGTAPTPKAAPSTPTTPGKTP